MCVAENQISKPLNRACTTLDATRQLLFHLLLSVSTLQVGCVCWNLGLRVLPASAYLQFDTQ